MGVRKYFILNSGGAIWTGPCAYREILRNLVVLREINELRQNPYPMPEVPKTGGWRKKLPLLYKALEGVIFEAGALRTIACRNGKRTREYREALTWITNHKERLIKPGHRPPRKELKLR